MATITVTITVSGTAVSPDPCPVSKDDDITFLSEDGAFEIEFKDKVPEKHADKKQESKEEGKKQKVKLKATNDKGTYDYVVRMGGNVTDPAIIIR